MSVNNSVKTTNMTSGRKLAKPAAYAGLLIMLSLIPITGVSPYYLHILIMTFTYIVAVASLRLIWTSGQIPLAHAAFMGIGAYASAVLAKNLNWTPWLTIPLGGLVAATFGIIIGIPFSRLRAIYYALASLFFGEGIIQVILALPKWTNSYGGLTGIPSLLPTFSKIPYYYLFLGFTTICLLAMYRFEHSRIGNNLKAIAQSHLVASSVGINEAKYRVLVLAVGCFFVGLTGAFYAHYSLTLSYDNFDLMSTLWLYVYFWIGGVGSFAGPIIGTSVLFIAPELLRVLKQYLPYVSAIILLFVVYLMPKGLAGLLELMNNLFTHHKKGGKVTDIA